MEDQAAAALMRRRHRRIKAAKRRLPENLAQSSGAERRRTRLREDRSRRHNFAYSSKDPNRFNPQGNRPHTTTLHQVVLDGRLMVQRGARHDSRDTFWQGTPPIAPRWWASQVRMAKCLRSLWGYRVACADQVSLRGDGLGSCSRH